MAMLDPSARCDNYTVPSFKLSGQEISDLMGSLWERYLG